MHKQIIKIGVAILSKNLCPLLPKMSTQFYDTLPTYEELNVPELHLTWPELKAGSLYFGRFCDTPCKVSLLYVVRISSKTAT